MDIFKNKTTIEEARMQGHVVVAQVPSDSWMTRLPAETAGREVAKSVVSIERPRKGHDY